MFYNKRDSVLMARPDNYRDEPIPPYFSTSEATISGYFFKFSIYFRLFIDLMWFSILRACTYSRFSIRNYSIQSDPFLVNEFPTFYLHVVENE